MNILYIGPSGLETTSRHRANALRRLGHSVMHFDPTAACAFHLRNKLAFHLHQLSGFRALTPLVASRLGSWIESQNTAFDLAWVNSGEWIDTAAIAHLRGACRQLVLYNNDDPTGGRDGRRFDTLLKNLPGYDLCAVVRLENVSEFLDQGARRVIRLYMGYDEVVHCPVEPVASLESEVAFIGTWMPERGPFMKALLDAHIPLSIWGDRWHKAPEWPRIRASWRGPGLRGMEYSQGVASSKVMIGLLSRGNRDLHTTRSSEIPAIGGLLCAQRTSEHSRFFRDGEEALLWSNPQECILQCERALFDPHWRNQIRANGHHRVQRLGLGNQKMCSAILECLQSGERVSFVTLPENELAAA